jgi:uncharacterized membrane protein YgdD (TMEM256/DUF423 family)
MKKIAIYASILGAIGVLVGAFGAHGVKGKISDYHYSSCRVGIEYLFFHLAPLLFIASQEYSKSWTRIAYFFIIGILFFTGSNVLMTTEAIHHINFHFLWPVTPIGGVLLVIAWVGLGVNLYKQKD